MCPNCRAFITTNDRVCPYCDFRLGPTTREQIRRSGPILGGLIPHTQFTIIIILLINTGLYLADVLGQQVNINMGADHVGVISLAGWSRPWPIDYFQPWRLVTAGFLHRDIIHILFNSWALFIFGAEVEQAYGTARTILLYFVSTVCGFFVSSYVGQLTSDGSSAGIFGLLGAMLAYVMVNRSSPMRGVYVQWLLYSVVISFLPGVDLYAHMGGLIGGFAVGYLVGTASARLAWKEPLIRALAGISLALTAIAFADMFFLIWG